MEIGDARAVAERPLKGCFAYELGADDRVVAVCPEWDSLAEAFSELGPRSADVVGTCIYSHLTGSEHQHLYSILFGRVRQTRAPMSVPFRCDGPEVRRFMRLLIEPLPEAHVRVTSVLVRREKRSRVALLDHASPRSGEFLSICAWCKRVAVDRAWVEAEEAAERLGLFLHSQLPQLTHTICERCNQVTVEEETRHFRRRRV